MSTLSILTVILPTCLIGLPLGAPAAGATTQISAGSGDACLIVAADREEKTWYFSGTVRYIDEHTGKEDYMIFSGVTARMTREQAMEFAKESGKAQGARHGRVISANVDTLF